MIDALQTVFFKPMLLGILGSVALAATPARSVASGAGGTPGDLVLIADFNQGVQNRLGGYHNKFEAGPSRANTAMSPDVFRGDSGRSLRIDAHRAASGFCGAWVHFFDFRASEPHYFDATSYPVLSFWVKGEKGGETFLVKLADETWIKKGDALSMGSVEECLPGKVTTEWREVQIPLSFGPAERLDCSRLGGLTLEFNVPGDYTVYIDDIAVKTSGDVPTPETSTVAKKALTTSAAAPPPPRAMWVWDTKPLLLDGRSRAEFFDFCKKENIGTVWMQVLSHFEPGYNVFGPPSGKPPEGFHAVIEHPKELRRFLKKAHAAGLAVHALDGYPEYAQKEYHYAPLAIVDGIIDFNRNGKRNERFDGIHLDNEPYLIQGWNNPLRRKRILREFLALNEEIQKRIRRKSDMVFGVDIPFWLQDTDPATGKANGLVSFHGVEKAASYHCIDLLDNVGIMDYRDTADGADGIITHAKDLLEYGDKAKHAKIFVGVETFAYRPTPVWFVAGLPRKRYEAALREKDGGLSFLSRISGYRVQVFDDGENVHVGIELPAIGGDEQKIRKALAGIARCFSARAYPDLKSRARDIRAAAMRGIDGAAEWKDAQARDVPSVGGMEIPGFVAVKIMAGKTTFADDSCSHLRKQLALSEAFFRSYKCFAGMAIHYYKTFREKTEQDASINL